ncbi:MAG: gene transfer agent family protein [Pseudomonadota bacterium]
MSGGNPWAGEVALVVDGERRVCKLTLSALAELEASMEADSLVALVDRFETGGFRARDVIALLVAGLRGGGWVGGARDLAAAEIEGGPVEATRVAALLLGRAFALPVRA